MSDGDEKANWVVSKIGLWWPDAEEGDIRTAAHAWDTFARAIDDAHDDGRGGTSQARANWTGDASDAFGKHWQIFDRAMPQSAAGARALAKGLRQYADEVEHAKNQVKELCAQIAIDFAVGAAMAFLTFGASEAVAAGTAEFLIAQAARIGVQLSARAAMIAGEVTSEAAFGAIESMASDGLGQVARVEAFHDGDYSASELLQAGGQGALDSGAGALGRGSKGVNRALPDDDVPLAPRTPGRTLDGSPDFVHPKTGVQFKNGFPQFESTHDYRLPPEKIGPDVSDGNQMRAATRDLRSTLEENPELRDIFSQDQLDAIQSGKQHIPGYTWHHHEDGETLQLVDQDIHARTGHDGGRATTGGRPR